jgi:AraC-like DNA-binding protein
VMMHGGFEAHLNRYAATGSEVLNLPLPARVEPETPQMQVADPDAVVRLAERDPLEAASFLLSIATPCRLDAPDWPEELAAALAIEPHLRLGDWARMRGLADATISRGFRKLFDVSPSTYRAQAKGRLAWRKIVSGRESLASVALDSGFCDQAHMTRTLGAVTGETPNYWREQVK